MVWVDVSFKSSFFTSQLITYVAAWHVSNVAAVHGIRAQDVHQALVQRGAGLEDAQIRVCAFTHVLADHVEPGRRARVLGAAMA